MATVTTSQESLVDHSNSTGGNESFELSYSSSNFNESLGSATNSERASGSNSDRSNDSEEVSEVEGIHPFL